MLRQTAWLVEMAAIPPLPGEVWGTLEFLDSAPSATSNWTAPADHLSELWSEASADFGAGLEQATGGDIDDTELDVPFQLSSGGLYPDYGAYGSEDCPEGMDCDVDTSCCTTFRAN